MSAEPFELDDVTSNRDCDLIPPSDPAGDLASIPGPLIGTDSLMRPSC